MEAVALDTGLPKEQRVCSTCSGLWARQPSRDFWNTVLPRILLPCWATAPHLPNQEGGNLTQHKDELGGCLAAHQDGTDLWAWTRRHPSSFCSPCMSWWHSELSPPATGTCVYTRPAYLTSGPSGCAPSARGVWAVAEVETAQSTAGSQAQAPSLAPQGSAVSSRDRSCSSCASPAFPTATAVTLCHLR